MIIVMMRATYINEIRVYFIGGKGEERFFSAKSTCFSFDACYRVQQAVKTDLSTASSISNRTHQLSHGVLLVVEINAYAHTRCLFITARALDSQSSASRDIERRVPFPQPAGLVSLRMKQLEVDFLPCSHYHGNLL